MRRPLGYRCYFRGNQKEMAKYILCILLSISILGMTKIIISTEQEELKGDFNDCKYMTCIQLKEWNADTTHLIERISALETVEGVFPYERTMTSCNMLFASMDEYTYFVDSTAVKLLVERMDGEFKDTDLPLQDSGGAVVAEKVARSKGYKKGKAIAGNGDIYEAAEYGHSYYSNFVPTTVSEAQKNYMVIPVLGKMDEMNEQIKELVPVDIEVLDIEKIKNSSRYMYEEVDENFNMIMMAITLMTSITIGGLSYFHYYGRKDEIELLSAIGYSDRWLIFRMTKEIVMTTALATLLAFSGLGFFCLAFNKLINEPNGYALFKLDGDVAILIANIVLFMMTFSIIPTWIMLEQRRRMILG